jgi:hypothetical protein
MLRLLILTFTLLFSTSVLAQVTPRSPCFPADTFKEKVTEEFKEQLVWMGLSSIKEVQNRVLVLYENEETRSWTLGLQIMQKDIVCFVASGGDFMHIEPKPPIKKGTKM